MLGRPPAPHGGIRFITSPILHSGDLTEAGGTPNTGQGPHASETAAEASATTAALRWASPRGPCRWPANALGSCGLAGGPATCGLYGLGERTSTVAVRIGGSFSGQIAPHNVSCSHLARAV